MGAPVVSLKFDKFGGQIPIVDDRLLPMENSTYAADAFLQSGRLEPLAANIAIHTLVNPAARYAYRVPKVSSGLDNITDSWWLEFGDDKTTVVRSPVANTADGGRYYWANGSAPPGYTTKSRLIQQDITPGSAPPLLLGIPRPAVAPVVTATGGVVPVATRAYVYTWVSIYGEEGQPSPPTIATENVNATWHVAVTAPTALDIANRALATTRIYRTEADGAGNAQFFFVAEMPITTLSYDDILPPDVVASAEQMQSEDWSAPPTDLKGMVSMPNGMIAGWRENEIWFCEPYRPHAWPVKYTINVEFPIVGFGTIDQNLMVLTGGQPYVATGVHPEVVALRQVQPIEPCTSQGSIVGVPNGVLYTSFNGLILIGPSGSKNVTFDMIRKDDWTELFNLGTVHASYFMGGYYAFSGAVEGVFQTEDAFQEDAFQIENFGGTENGSHISLADSRLGMVTVTSDDGPTYNVMTDVWTGETLVIRGGKVVHVDRRKHVPRQSYTWRSKIVQTPFVDNFAAVKIYYDLPEGGEPIEQTVFRYYANNILRFTRPVRKSGEQFRLPSGFKTDFVQFELEGQYMIYNMQIATSAHELREV